MHSGSCGLTWTFLAVVGFIRIGVGLPDLFGIAWVLSGSPSGRAFNSVSL